MSESSVQQAMKDKFLNLHNEMKRRLEAGINLSELFPLYFEAFRKHGILPQYDDDRWPLATGKGAYAREKILSDAVMFVYFSTAETDPTWESVTGIQDAEKTLNVPVYPGND